MRRVPCTPAASWRFVLLTLLVALAGPASMALAQTGQFVESSPPWIGPGGSPGVAIQSGQIWVDTNGSGLSEVGQDTFHPIPAGSGLASGWSLSLSPSRRVMVAITSSGASCPGTAPTIRLYAIPATNGADLTLLNEKTLTRCIARVGFFDDPTDPVRTAFFWESPHPTTGLGTLLWFDMVTGAAAPSTVQFATGYGEITSTPFGTMAWVKHRVSAPGGTDYALVSLCPATLGATSGSAMTGQSGTRNAFVVGSGPYSVKITAGDVNATQLASLTYDDCSLPPPVVGACCLPGGGCLGGTTSGECSTLGGTWRGQGVSCPSTCPPPPTAILVPTFTVPDTSLRGSNLTYTYTVRNDGALSSNSVSLVVALPLGTSFLSASGSGVFGGSNVTWALGTITPGALQQRTLTVLTGCVATSAISGGYSVSGTPGGNNVGVMSKTTVLVAQPTAGFTVSGTSVAQSPVPLQTGGITRHTVFLTNSLPVPREYVKVTMFAGMSSQVSSVINAGGGTATNNFSNLVWNGSVAASSSISIIYETQVKACRPETTTVEAMNRGNPLTVLNACNSAIATAAAPAGIAVAGSPLSVRLTSPTHGPVQTWNNGENRIIAARPGAVIDLAISIRNASPSLSPAVTLTMQLPIELLPVGSPPFLGAPPAGLTWDGLQNTLTYVGSIPANDSTVILIRTKVDSSACGLNLEPVGSFSGCNGLLRSELKVMIVPAPPTGPYLMGLYTSDGLWTWQPGAASVLRTGCVGFENLRGMGRAPGGDVWVVGTPSFRLNPVLMEFEILSGAFFAAMDMDYPNDVAADPRDSTLVFAGYKSGFGARLRRYNPRTHVVSMILNDAGFVIGSANKIAIASDGLMGVATGSKLMRVPPANPAGYQLFTTAGLDGVESVAIDLDGHFVIVEADITGNGPQRVMHVDRTTGVFTTIVDLYGTTLGWTPLKAIAVEPDSDLYAGFYTGGTVRIARKSANALTWLPPAIPLADLEWVGGNATTAVEDPDAPTSDARGELAFAIAPNPFRGAAGLSFTLPVATHVDIGVFDVSGRRLRTLTRQPWGAGRHELRWDGRDDGGQRVGAGLYFLRMQTEGSARVVRAARIE